MHVYIVTKFLRVFLTLTCWNWKWEEARRSQDSKRQMCHADLDFAVEDAAWAAWLACGLRAPKAHPAPRATAAVEQCKPFTSMSCVGNLKRPTRQNHTFSLYIICWTTMILLYFASQVTFLDVKVSDAGHRPAQPFKTSCRYAHSALICANYSWFGSFMQQMETVMHMKSRWQLRDDCPFLAQHSVVCAACPRASTCTRRLHRTTRDPS